MIGKIVGGMLGLMLGGVLAIPWLGLAFGLWLGHRFDHGLEQWFRAAHTQSHRYNSNQQVFFDTTFAVMGHIAKSNGRVSNREIEVAKAIMHACGLSPTMRKQAIKAFGRGKQPDFQLHPTINHLRQTCMGHIGLLHLFLDCQYKMAYAEGPPTAYMQQLLERMARQLGLSPNPDAFQEGWFEQGRPHQPSTTSSLTQAYHTLGLKPGAPMQEVKRAYRKLMAANHPDRLIAKGLPDDMIKMATEKTQAIKAAYDRIKKEA